MRQYLLFFVGPGGEDGDAGALPTTLRRKKAAVEFDRDEDDAPILNDPSQMMARVMEPMVRQFLSIYYSESISSLWHVGSDLHLSM